MSTRWKVIVPTVVFAVLIGGMAWAASGGSTSSKTSALGQGSLGQRISALASAPNGAGLAGRGPAWVRWRERIAHVTHAQIGIVVDGQSHELTVQHGVLTAVGGDSLTVKEADGSTPTVSVDSNTKVRLDGRPSSLDKLQVGDRVFTVQVDGGAARFVVAFDAKYAPGSADATDAADAGQQIAALLGSAA